MADDEEKTKKCEVKEKPLGMIKLGSKMILIVYINLLPFKE